MPGTAIRVSKVVVFLSSCFLLDDKLYCDYDMSMHSCRISYDIFHFLKVIMTYINTSSNEIIRELVADAVACFQETILDIADFVQ